jgi:hemerythrin superfamily protein
MASKRELISPRGDKRFVRRDAKGRITESDDVGRSLAQDRRRAAKTAAKPGQGDRGDRKPNDGTTPRKTPMKKTATRKASARKSTGTARKSATRSARKSSTRAAAASRAPNAIALLKADHATVRELLGRLEETTARGTKVREELLARIRREVEAHTSIEEEIFYPAFKAARERGDDDKMYFEALEEHRAAGDLVLPDLLATDPSSECFSGRAKVLKELIEHHAKEEEREMFPRARELLSADELQALGERMAQRKRELLAQPAPPKTLAGRVLTAVVDAIAPDADANDNADVPRVAPTRRGTEGGDGAATRTSR